MRLDGFKRDAAGAIIAHCTRHAHDPNQSRHVYKNQKIDRARTAMNYDLHAVADPARKVAEAVAWAEKAPGKTTDVLSSWVVTLPYDWPAERDPRDFFESAYRTLVGRIGEERAVGGYVHMDETTPHMHLLWVPTALIPREENDKSRPKLDPRTGEQKRDKKGTLLWERKPKLDAEGNQVFQRGLRQGLVCDQEYMRAAHPLVQEAVLRDTGVACHVLLDDEDRVGKALSDVPQDRLDTARAAIVGEAEAERDAARDEADRARAARDRAVRERIRAERDRDLAVSIEQDARVSAELAQDIRDEAWADADLAREEAAQMLDALPATVDAVVEACADLAAVGTAEAFDAAERLVDRVARAVRAVFGAAEYLAERLARRGLDWLAERASSTLRRHGRER